jgi:hypothetical protein
LLDSSFRAGGGMTGWIKIHRKFMKWGWADKPEMVSLFIHLLVEANYEDKIWRGQTIKAGELVFGRKAWSKSTGISEQSLRTCIDRLKSTGEITIKTTNKYSIITIVKYKEYQILNCDVTSKSTNTLTSNQPTTNQQLTTPKEVKKERSKEYIYTPEFLEFWTLYPRKEAKGNAYKAYNQSIKKVTHKEIIGALKKSLPVMAQKEKEYIPHPATWLNQRRWEDEVTTTRHKIPSPAGG